MSSLFDVVFDCACAWCHRINRWSVPADAADLLFWQRCRWCLAFTRFDPAVTT